MYVECGSFFMYLEVGPQNGVVFKSQNRLFRLKCHECGLGLFICLLIKCAIEREYYLNQLGGRYRSFSPDRQERFICRIVGAPCDPVSAMKSAHTGFLNEHVLSPLQYLQDLHYSADYININHKIWDMYVSSI